jgi:hypothetical protein
VIKLVYSNSKNNTYNIIILIYDNIKTKAYKDHNFGLFEPIFNDYELNGNVIDESLLSDEEIIIKTNNL